ncbi:DUF1016 N-terminal domain-containing protein [Solimicrobium silvestre]
MKHKLGLFSRLKVIDRLTKDLKQELPDMKGLSRSNLMYMRAFANAWPAKVIVQEVLGQLPRVNEGA